MTPEGMAAVLHNEALVRRFSGEGAPYAVLVQLERDRAAVSGYRWSSGTGPPIRLTTGTLARAEITTRESSRADVMRQKSPDPTVGFAAFGSISWPR